MRGEPTLVVVDAAPPITLAAAGSLDYLLYPRLPVVIPDAVFHEATAYADKLGAQAILDWYREHSCDVRIEPTRTFQDAIVPSETTGRRLPRDLGERAAREIVRDEAILPAGETALLLSDDRDARRLVVVDPGTVVLLTTWDYLVQLEEARRIQSAAAIMEAVRARGRQPPSQDLLGAQAPEVREAVRKLLTDEGRRSAP